MTAILNVLARPFAEIRKGERLKTLLMFFYFFLTINLIYILKPLQKSWFIDEFGAQNLRYGDMGQGIFLIVWVGIYAYLAKKLSGRIFYISVLGFFITNLLLFGFVLHAGIPYVSAFFYLWQASFSITLTTVFWTIANDIFDATQAKRLFGIILSGGSIGGICGGLITAEVVKHFEVEYTFGVAAVILAVCMGVVFLLWNQIPVTRGEGGGPVKEEEPKKESAQTPIMKLFKDASYLRMLCAIVVIAKVASTVVDNQLGGVVGHAFEGAVDPKAAMAAFYGNFFGGLNALSLVMQLIVTSLCLRFLGVGFSIWILPVGLSVLSVASFLHPVLLTGVVFRLFDGSVNYSVQQASKEVFYLPISSDVRRRIKPVIDMLGYRFAKSLGGVYIAIFAFLFHLPVEKIGILVLLLAPAWFFIAWKMKRSYSALLKENLLHRGEGRKVVETEQATDVLGLLHGEKTLEGISRLMNHHSSYARKLAAAAKYAYEKLSSDLESTRKAMNKIMETEAGSRSDRTDGGEDKEARDRLYLEKLAGEGNRGTSEEGSLDQFLMEASEDVFARLADTIKNPSETIERKRQALRLLRYIPLQKTVDLLLSALAETDNHAARFVMIKSLSRICKRNPSVEITRVIIKNEIAREMAMHEDIIKATTFYSQEKKDRQDEDQIGIALSAILEENVERVFQFLALLYPDEMIPAIYEEMVARTSAPSIRVLAAELLANTIEPDLLIMIQRVLDNRQILRLKDADIRRVLKRFVASKDPWFSLVGRFLVCDLKLWERWPEFEKCREHKDHPFFAE